MVAIGLFAILSSIFVVGFYLNQKTPKPEGCENINETCGSCNIVSCLNHPSTKTEEIK